MTTISTGNYTVGGVDLYFNASIAPASLNATTGGVTPGSTFRHAGNNLGNIITSEIVPDVTYLEHYVAVNGKRKKDKVVVSMESITIPFTFDEMNEANIQKFFLASNLSGNKLAVLQEPLNEGSVSLHFRTNVGQDMVYSIPKAIIRPDGPLSIGNGEDWWSAPMVIEVLSYTGGQWASKPYGVLDTAPGGAS